MRVLWICNQCVPQIAEKLNIPGSNKEGWLAGIFERLDKEDADITLGLAFPNAENMEADAGRYKVYGFSEDTTHPENYDEAVTGRMKEIMDDFSPDIVHVFGTEYAHTLSAAKALNNPGKLLIAFQGVCGALAEAYLTGVDEEWIHKTTFRDSLKKDNMAAQKEKFALRGEHEKEAVALAGYVTGRTRLDKKYTAVCNPKAEYLFMNETMRKTFYEESPEIKSEKGKHIIFVSQCDYPIKGFHILLKALKDVKKEYPDLEVRVAGIPITGVGGLKKKVLIPTYGQYLKHLMKEGGLEDSVHFLGILSAQEMKKEYLSCNVFILPSVMENSPNCLGEAMLLGVPCIASNVGGVADICAPETDGILYDDCDPAKLKEAVIRVFKDLDAGGEETAKRTGTARADALSRHDGDTNFKRLKEIYRIIYDANAGEQK